MHEIACFFRAQKKTAWIPPAALVTPFLLLFALRLRGEDPMLLYGYLGNTLPIVSAFWVILSLREPVAQEGGEIFFVCRPGPAWWILRTFRLILLYAVPALIASAVAMRQIGPVGTGLLVRMLAVSILYGWAGFALMHWTRDLGWAWFGILAFYFIGMSGRGLAEFPLNVHMVSVVDRFPAIPWAVIARAAVASTALAMLGFSRRYRM